MAAKGNTVIKPEDEKRLKTNFVPTWSNHFFEGVSSLQGMIGVAGSFGSIIIGLILIAGFTHGQIKPVIITTVAVIAAGVITTSLWKWVIARLKEPGTLILATHTERTDFFGRKHVVMNSAWAEEYLARGARLTGNGIEFRAGMEKLVFPYEVGDAKMQAHIGECYKSFGDYLGQELPPFTTTAIDLIDHRYFYRKSRRNQLILLLIASLFFYAAAASRSVMGAAGALLFILPVELSAINRLLKSAQLSELNTTALMMEMGSGQLVNEKEKRSGYVIFTAALIAVVIFNALILINL